MYLVLCTVRSKCRSVGNVRAALSIPGFGLGNARPFSEPSFRNSGPARAARQPRCSAWSPSTAIPGSAPPIRVERVPTQQ